jgi:16S rRNA (adenine1518-N6/adenine1519-N6)-dimethyltransferase
MAQKSKFGQNFLKNKFYIDLIAKRINPSKKETIIEIGAGHGELTSFILKYADKSSKIIAIEKDKNLCLFLTARFKEHKNLEIVCKDALKNLEKIIKDEKLKNFGYKIVGNIPYYITGYLLRILSKLKTRPQKIIFLLQKEVALKITSAPPKMNLLAAITQSWCVPKIISAVNKKNFSPEPKVDSAIIELNIKKENEIDRESFYKFVRRLFSHPRKTILNNLAFNKESKEEILKKLTSLNINPLARPQELSLDKILKLFKII